MVKTSILKKPIKKKKALAASIVDFLLVGLAAASLSLNLPGAHANVLEKTERQTMEQIIPSLPQHLQEEGHKLIESFQNVMYPFIDPNVGLRKWVPPFRTKDKKNTLSLLVAYERDLPDPEKERIEKEVLKPVIGPLSKYLGFDINVHYDIYATASSDITLFIYDENAEDKLFHAIVKRALLYSDEEFSMQKQSVEDLKSGESDFEHRRIGGKFFGAIIARNDSDLRTGSFSQFLSQAMFRVFGALGNGMRLPSILSKNEKNEDEYAFTHLTVHDLNLLSLLYKKELLPDMTVEETLPIIRRLTWEAMVRAGAREKRPKGGD